MIRMMMNYTGGGCTLALMLDRLLEGHHGGGQLGDQGLVGVSHVPEVKDLVKTSSLHQAIELLHRRIVTGLN